MSPDYTWGSALTTQFCQPAIKLLDFFNAILARARAKGDCELPMDALGFALFETEQVQRFSKTVRELQELDADYARGWIRYWRKRHVF